MSLLLKAPLLTLPISPEEDVLSSPYPAKQAFVANSLHLGFLLLCCAVRQYHPEHRLHHWTTVAIRLGPKLLTLALAVVWQGGSVCLPLGANPRCQMLALGSNPDLLAGLAFGSVIFMV